MTQKPLVVHVIECFAGGTAAMLRTLIGGLPQYGHLVIHGARADEMHPDEVKATFPPIVQFAWWPHVQRELNPLGDIKATWALYRLLRQLSPLAVHLHSSKAGFAGRVAARMAGISKVYYTTHAVSFLRQDISALKQGIFIKLEQLGQLFGGTTVACGASEQELMQQYGLEAIAIPNGIADGAGQETSLKLPPGAIVTVGRCTIQKNPARFAALAKALPDQSFVWIGEGELEAPLRDAGVTITGWQPPKSINAVLRQASVYLSTSDWEGLPLSVLEALRAGLPLVLSNCVGNKDLVIPGQNGFHFDSNEEAVLYLQQLANDASLRERMGAASRQLFQQKFSIEACAAAYARLYEQG